jgi:hypothetical protein
MRKAVEQETLQALVEPGAARELRVLCGVLTCGNGNQNLTLSFNLAPAIDDAPAKFLRYRDCPRLRASA